MFGFLNVNKIGGVTSRAVVNRVDSIVRKQKVGHAGTLDPLATGVLIICVGPATRLARYVQAFKKTYLAEFKLGFEADTEDVLGEVTEVGGLESVTEQAVIDVLPEFVGAIEQMPPKFSALKVNGKRAYDLARKGKEFELKPRQIVIEALSLKRFEPPYLELEISCGSGTYVRSLGRDIGRRLGTGAIMSKLCRTSIGGFKVEDAISSDKLEWPAVQEVLVKPQDGIVGAEDLEFTNVADSQLERFSMGHIWEPDSAVSAQEIAAIDDSGRLLAILNRKSENCYTPKTNFTQYWLKRLGKSK